MGSSDDGPTREPDVDARVARTRDDVLGAALALLVAEGPDAVTHHRVAHAAGYSRATLYNHWPTRHHLLRAAFGHVGEARHHEPTGDLRADLVAELTNFREEIRRHRLDRSFGALVGLMVSVPGLDEVRDRMVADGERVLRTLLAPVAQGSTLEAATLMLAGTVLNSMLLHGRPAGDDLIADAVDVALRGLPPGPPGTSPAWS